jgi:hypothetical protein
MPERKFTANVPSIPHPVNNNALPLPHGASGESAQRLTPFCKRKPPAILLDSLAALLFTG